MRKVIVLVALLSVFAFAQSPFEGTWKVNAAHAQFLDKPDTFVLQKGEYTCTTCAPTMTVKADGTDQKVPGAKDYDTLSVKQVNDKAVRFTRKKDGKVVSESTDTVSPDGQTLISDFKEYPPDGKPVSGKYIMMRFSPGPPGSHAISGSWRPAKIEDVSDNALMFTLRATADGLNMKSGTGESYDAKFDGKEYPLKGGRADRTVSLRRVNDTTIEETIRQDGKPFMVTRMSVEGKSLKFVSKNPDQSTTMSFTADKQ